MTKINLTRLLSTEMDSGLSLWCECGLLLSVCSFCVPPYQAHPGPQSSPCRDSAVIIAKHFMPAHCLMNSYLMCFPKSEEQNLPKVRAQSPDPRHSLLHPSRRVVFRRLVGRKTEQGLEMAVHSDAASTGRASPKRFSRNLFQD